MHDVDRCMCMRIQQHIRLPTDHKTEIRPGESRCTCGTCGAPRLVAFTGKRQYMELMNIGRVGKAKLKNVKLGRQTGFPEARLWHELFA